MEMDKKDWKTLEELFPEDPTGLREVNTRYGHTMPVGSLRRKVYEEHTGSPDADYWAVSFSEEFCALDCQGTAHETGRPDAREGCFCGLHVHRSVWVEVRKFPDMASDIQQM